MSTPPQIISKVRRLSHCTSTQYSDADAYSDINDVKAELWNKCVSEWFSSSYNWDIWTTDSQTLVSEYKMDIPTSTNVGQKVINNIYINYDWLTYEETGLLKYIKCSEKDPKNLPYSWEYYEENQDSREPIYFQKDNSIFIAPAPRSDQSGANRIKLEWIRNLPEWDANTTELQMKFPIEFHYIFEYWLMPYALASKWADDSKINNAMVIYQNKSKDVVNQMTQRVEAPFFNTYPEENIDPLDLKPY